MVPAFLVFIDDDRALRMECSGTEFTYFTFRIEATREGVAMLPRNRSFGRSPRRNFVICTLKSCKKAGNPVSLYRFYQSF